MAMREGQTARLADSSWWFLIISLRRRSHPTGEAFVKRTAEASLACISLSFTPLGMIVLIHNVLFFFNGNRN